MGYMQDLAMIYEGYRGSGDPGPGLAVGQLPTHDSSVSYPKDMWTAASGKSDVTSMTAGVPVVGGEDEEVEPKRPIKHNDLIGYINNEIHKAQSYGHDYTLMVLSELKNKILGGSKNKKH